MDGLASLLSMRRQSELRKPGSAKKNTTNRSKGIKSINRKKMKRLNFIHITINLEAAL